VADRLPDLPILFHFEEAGMNHRPIRAVMWFETSAVIGVSFQKSGIVGL
jgi:hypothetical protein